jgi:hypothetical protein
MANIALGIAPLPERQASGRQFIFRPAIRTFEDHHGFTLRLWSLVQRSTLHEPTHQNPDQHTKSAQMRRASGGDYLLSEEDFGLYTPTVRAFILVDRKVATSWMLLDTSKLYWLAASRAGIIQKQVKRHGGS